MKKLLFALILLSACHKTTNNQSTQSPPPNTTSNLHTVMVKFIGTSNPVIRHYQRPDANNIPSLSKDDTVYSSSTSVTYQFKQGSPNAYWYHNMAFVPTPSDSIRIEIWVDGTFRTGGTDAGYYDLNFYY